MLKRVVLESRLASPPGGGVVGSCQEAISDFFPPFNDALNVPRLFRRANLNSSGGVASECITPKALQIRLLIYFDVAGLICGTAGFCFCARCAIFLSVI